MVADLPAVQVGLSRLDENRLTEMKEVSATVLPLKAISTLSGNHTSYNPYRHLLPKESSRRIPASVRKPAC
jgi:hypothetical protein